MAQSDRRYLIILGDGMADHPQAILDNKTALEAAQTPTIDRLTQAGSLGTLSSIPQGFEPGSDVANMAILGFDPERYYSGRSPLEALSLGVNLDLDDLCLRMNLVTLSDETDYDSKTLLDYSAGEIDTELAKALIDFLNQRLDLGGFELYAGKRYRHILRLPHLKEAMLTLTPAHNITGQCISAYLPKGDTVLASKLYAIMREATQLLEDHPYNLERKSQGLPVANGIWFWGEGSRPSFPSFEAMHGVSGTVISAVDLLQGMAKASGLRAAVVQGATGDLHTNYEGKVRAAIQAFEEGDRFVYVHLEGPDECGHQKDALGKVHAIEAIDARVLCPLWRYLEDCRLNHHEAYSIMLLPDHATPLELGHHTSEPIPFVHFDSSKPVSGAGNAQRYTEAYARMSDCSFGDGPSLLRWFLDETL